jgi:hypothetical protein
MLRRVNLDPPVCRTKYVRNLARLRKQGQGTIAELGRWKLAGSYRTHTVKIVREDETDLPGATVSVDLADSSVGTFIYSAMR